MRGGNGGTAHLGGGVANWGSGLGLGGPVDGGVWGSGGVLIRKQALRDWFPLGC